MDYAFADVGSTFDGWQVNGVPVSGLTNVFPGDTVTAIFVLAPTPTPTPTATPPVPAPVADFVAAPVRGYAPLTVVLTNTSQGDVTASTWEFGDGQTSTDQHPGHVYETAGTYTVGLTVDGASGSDTLTRTDLIEVLHDNQPPVITITSPAENAVVAAGDIMVTGTVNDDGMVTSVLVNAMPATISGTTFTATVPLTTGPALLAVMAEDSDGAFGFAGQVVQVDGDGPEIDIQAPAGGQSVYTLTPTIDVTYNDFSSTMDITTLQVLLTDEHDVTTNVTADVTVSPAGASGTVTTPLTEDTRYT